MHILIIPDGNRRWAKLKGLATFVGHKKGVERFSEIIDEVFKEQMVNFLTFWVLSIDNLVKRSKEEIDFLLNILDAEFTKQLESKRYEELQIQFRAVGLWEKYFSHRPELVEKIHLLQKKTAQYNKNYLTMLLAYDGFTEMTEGFLKMGKENIFPIDFKTIHENLWTNFLPEVDGIIRTGVENDPHNSGGVMMWLTGHSQYFFTSMKFPDFDKFQTKLAIEDFKKRARRLGK
jgi:undecaprenyl diphosphate synthase